MALALEDMEIKRMGLFAYSTDRLADIFDVFDSEERGYLTEKDLRRQLHSK